MDPLSDLSDYIRKVAEYLQNPPPPPYGKLPRTLTRNEPRQWFQYVSKVGEGVSAEAHRFTEYRTNKDNSISFVRDVVVKTSSTSDDDDIKNDRYWLRILRNAPHIVDLIDINHNLRRPIFITEFLPFGTLSTLQKAVIADGTRPWPSRILWRIFLCRKSSSPGPPLSTLTKRKNEHSTAQIH